MIKSILYDVWHRKGDYDDGTAVHIYTRSGRGYHNIVLTILNDHGIIFYEEDDSALQVGGKPKTRIVMSIDAIDSVELVDR